MSEITTTTDAKQGKLYAGPAPLPQGATLIGTVTRYGYDTGALVELANGRQVQYNAGVIRNLPGVMVSAVVRKERQMDCNACNLSKTSHQIVWGIPRETGRSCTIMLIGDAPGRAEDLVGQPFTGETGKLLGKMLDDAEGMDKEKLFLTYAVKCHPFMDLSHGEGEATKEQAEICWPHLEKEIEELRPYVVVFVGKLAQRFCQAKIRGMKINCETVLMHHPYFVLRNGGEGSSYYLHCVRSLDLAVELSHKKKEEGNED